MTNGLIWRTADYSAAIVRTIAATCNTFMVIAFNRAPYRLWRLEKSIPENDLHRSAHRCTSYAISHGANIDIFALT